MSTPPSTPRSDPAVRAPVVEVDWDLAARWGGRLASPGPTPSRATLEETVASLRDAAERALPLALKAARLGPAVAASGREEDTAQVLVVDRPGWMRAAGQSFDAMTAEVLGHPGTGAGAGTGPATRLVQGARSAPGTAQAAAVLSVLSSRVLGQFDPFAASAPVGGRLLLVAPNILRMERLISADPDDFRLWVCLHEQTHALQFAAAPWLVDHLRGQVAELVHNLSTTTPSRELGSAVAATRRAVSHRDAGPVGLGLLELALDPDQRRQVERLTAVMSLLEGHADVAMDAVGPRTIPSVRRLRSRFDARRRRVTGVDRVLRRALGLDAKLEQYRRGAAFVREVRRAGGRKALDAVWSGPQALPTPAEIADPGTWVERVHG